MEEVAASVRGHAVLHPGSHEPVHHGEQGAGAAAGVLHDCISGCEVSVSRIGGTSPPPAHHLHPRHRALQGLEVVVVVVIVLVVVVVVPVVVVVGHHADCIKPSQQEGKEAEGVEASAPSRSVLSS